MGHLDIAPGLLVAELRRRLDRYRDTGDAALVLDREWHERVRTAHRELTRTADPAVLATVGLWYLRRYHVLPPGYDRVELRAAQGIAAMLAQIRPDALPPELAGLLAPSQHPTAAPMDEAIMMLSRFELHGDVAAARQALAMLAETTRTAPPDDPLLPLSLANLAHVRIAHFMIDNGIADVDDAVRVAREALALTSDPAQRCFAMTSLSSALSLRAQRTGQIADLDEAVQLGRNAIAIAPDPLNRGKADNCLSRALWTRGERTGRMADLDEAIQAARDALPLIPKEHPFYPSAAGSLLLGLTRRYQRLGDPADGDETLRIGMELLAATAPQDPQRCVFLATFALSLLARYSRTLAPEDLAEALRISEQAVEASRDLGGHRHWILSNHSVLHFMRFLATASPDDADAAIIHARQAIEATAQDDPRRASHGRALAQMLLAKSKPFVKTAETTPEWDDVNEAMELGRAAVAAISPGHPSRASCLNTLADAYRGRFVLTGDPADLDSAAGLWRSAAGSRVSSADSRMVAARSWHNAAVKAGHTAFATEACIAAVDLLPILAWRGLDRASQEKRLAGVAGLAGDAGAYALRDGNPRQAVELLEQGRSVLWAQTLQTRSDLTDLEAADPELARRLHAVRLALDAGQATALSTTDDNSENERIARRYRRLAEQWDALVREARKHPGFAHFLDVAPFDHLRHAGDDGPVVVVNTSDLRCDALVVTPDEVRVVPLPWLRQADAHQRVAVLIAAQRETEADGSTVARAHFRQTLTALLRWLWDTVAEPVLDAITDLLPATDDGTPPRLWWCPTGPMTLLPLHAAGRHGGTALWRRRRKPTVPDQVVSSYTTGLSALIRARGRPRPDESPRVLLIGMPETDGMAALPGVRGELRGIATTVPDASGLVGADATTRRVLAGLRSHSWAHFACHGTQDIQQPSSGAIHLADGRLSVLELAGHPIPSAEFAYLSACHTATGSPGLADEAIHLIAALQMAGYRHVIGTQWSVGDEHAAAVSAAVYQHIAGQGRRDPADAAVALHRAVGTLRAADPERPDVWAPYVHAGP